MRNWRESRIILTLKRRAKCVKFVLRNDFLNYFPPELYLALSVKEGAPIDIVEDIHSIVAPSKRLRCDSLFNACLHANEEIIDFLLERNPEDFYATSIQAYYDLGYPAIPCGEYVPLHMVIWEKRNVSVIRKIIQFSFKEWLTDTMLFKIFLRMVFEI